MGLIINPFEDDSIFGVVPLTQAISLVPNTYGYLTKRNIFNFTGVAADSVVIEMMNNVLQLLPSKERGGNSNQAKQEKRSAVSLKIPHIPLEDFIRPSEFKGIRAFGTDNQLEHASNVMLRKLEKNHRSYEVTWEFLYWGAMKGVVIDGDGETILANLFNAFNVTKKVINFELDNPESNIEEKCYELTSHIEDNLYGDVMTGVRCAVSPEFFADFIKHPNVEKFYLNHAEALKLIGNPRKGFTFAGVTFEEYRGRAPLASGEIKRFIDIGKGHAYPEGTYETFGGAYGPGDFMDTADTEGIAIYARQEPLRFNKGVDLYFESNPLPYVTRPGVLVEVLRNAADA